MNICAYRFDEYADIVKSFHGSLAPGILVGGFMIDLAMNNLPEGDYFDVICETQACLPDAVQLLTPCTIGNGWLRIVDFGRFALIFYNKYSGIGVRIYLDIERLDDWTEIRSWFLKEKPKKEQDLDLLITQIKEAGHRIYGIQRVKLKPEFIEGSKKTKKPVAICDLCHEAFKANPDNVCPACRGESPYRLLDQEIK